MAKTNLKSEQIKMNDMGKIDASADNAKVRLACFDFAQGETAGDAGSTADLVVLPANCRILPALSRITTSALGATLDVGLRAYKNVEGVAVAEDADAIGAALATSSETSVAMGEGYIDVASQGSVVVFATGTLPAKATLKGYIAYLAD